MFANPIFQINLASETNLASEELGLFKREIGIFAWAFVIDAGVVGENGANRVAIAGNFLVISPDNVCHFLSPLNLLYSLTTP